MISLVIPVYNEVANLPALHEQVTAAAQSWGEEYEVIVVDDASSDGSSEMLADMHRDDPCWKTLRFSRNFGHQTAVSAGIHYSRGDAVVIIDGDLQDPPAVIGQLIDRWREGFEVVYAVRRSRKENMLLVACYVLFYRILQRLASIEIPLDSGDFCLLDRRIVEVLKAMPERARFVRGLRSWAGFRQVGVEYERDARRAGEAKYTLRKLMQLAVNGLISFSSAPLRMASWLGTSLCLLSVLMVFALGVWWATGLKMFGMHPADSVGWTSIVSLMLLLFGMQMLLTGIIGEYIACLFEEVKARPPWIIAAAHGFDSESHADDTGWFAAGPPATTRDEAADRG